mgnify:CR=1 FL=1
MAGSRARSASRWRDQEKRVPGRELGRSTHQAICQGREKEGGSKGEMSGQPRKQHEGQGVKGGNEWAAKETARVADQDGQLQFED